MIPNPWMILGAVFLAISLYFYGHHKGWAERNAEMQAEIAIKNEESRAKEQEMGNKLNEQSTKLQEANNVLNEKQTALDRAIRSGRVRISSSSCVQTPTNSTTPSTNTETRGEPDRQVNENSDAERATLQAIAQIVADGDKAINQLNACIDAFNQVRETVNGK
jgi:hypothetical protein